MMKIFTFFYKPFLPFIRLVGNVFLPPTCVECETLLQGEKGLSVCPQCFTGLPFIPLEKRRKGLLAVLPADIDHFSAPFYYHQPVQKWVQRLKFKDTEELAAPLAHFLLKTWREEKPWQELGNVLILPVPLHASRLRTRGFNQAHIVAKNLCHTLNENQGEAEKEVQLDVYSLKRIKKTKSQLGQSAASRKRNLTGAFSVEKEAVKGKDVVLIDDVWTTGSTAAACAKCLKRAGAKSVNVLTLCYVPMEGA